MRSKIIWKWVLTGALSSVFLLHPFVMLTGYFMREPFWVHGQSVLDVILHETLLTFNQKMIPWNLSFAVLGALVGLFYGRTKQAKKALREVEGKYQELAESISDVFFVMDKNLRYTYWNKASEILTGIPSEKVVGKTLIEVFPDNAALEQVKKMYLRVIETKKPMHLIVTYPGNEQIVHEINTYPTIEGVSVFVKDITEHKRAEDALRESEERYRILFESSRDAIMTLTPPTWLFISGNPATVELFKVRDEAEFISLTPWQLSPERQPDDKPSEEKSREMIETAMRNGSHFFEWTHCHSDGTPFSAEVLLTRMEQGSQVLLQATVRDITERKRAAEERDRFVLILQDTLKRVETLSAISQTVNQSLNLDQILNDALDKVMELFNPSFLHIRLFDDQTQEMVLAAYKGHTPEDLKKLAKRKKIGNTVTSHAMKAGAAVVIKDPLTDPRVTDIDSFGNKIGCRSMINLVLYAKNKMLGNMAVFFMEPHAFTDDEVQLFTSIGHQVGTAIENAQLYQQTQHTVKDLKQAYEERERLVSDLQKTLSEVKTLRGFLPICSNCKKIRDDKGYWNQIESYIQKYSDAEFSHSICPECAKELYPDLDIYDDNGEVTHD